MSFLKGYKAKSITNVIELDSDAESIWNEITNVSLSEVKFPFLLSLLGVPKPLSAQVLVQGVGGYREAYFEGDIVFRQEITQWEINKNYRFKFNASNNFKVGYLFNLAKGPFEIVSGGYELIQRNSGNELVLLSHYSIHGFLGFILHIPCRLVVYYFQIYLLEAIKKNLK